MRFRFFSVLAAIVSLAMLPAQAHADTLQAFQFAGVTFQGLPNTLNGTIVVNTTAGTFVSADLTYTDGSATYHFFDPNLQTKNNIPNQVYTSVTDFTHNYEFALDIPWSLVGYTGGSLCTMQYSCWDGGTTNYISAVTNFSNQTLAPMATGYLVPTPEPSSLLLLGTGLAGASGVIKRRFLA